MKKTYQSPEALVVKIQIQRSLLLSASDTTVSGENGGWVKELADDDDCWMSSDKSSVWDEEW